MPLLAGRKNIGHNIKVEEESGKPRKQAVAIALSKAAGRDADRAITQRDLDDAARGLRMLGMDLDELRDVIKEHQGKDMFMSKVITQSAKQMLAAKSRMGAKDALPRPVAVRGRDAESFAKGDKVTTDVTPQVGVVLSVEGSGDMAKVLVLFGKPDKYGVSDVRRLYAYLLRKNGKAKDSLPLPVAVKGRDDGRQTPAQLKALRHKYEAMNPRTKRDQEDVAYMLKRIDQALNGDEPLYYAVSQSHAADSPRTDEDAYFKRRKEIEAELNKKRPNDDTNKLRAHEQTLREQGKRVEPYRTADARESLCNNCGQPRSRCECAKPSFAKDASPESQLEEAQHQEVAQDHVRAMDSYRQAASGFRRIGDQRNEQIARDGIAECQRQSVGSFHGQYEHPSVGKVQAFDAAPAALRSAVERTRAGERVRVAHDEATGEEVVEPLAVKVKDGDDWYDERIKELEQEVARCKREGEPYADELRDIAEYKKERQDRERATRRSMRDALPLPVKVTKHR